MTQKDADINLEQLVADYGALVSSVCRRMVRNEEDAKDAAQEAWAEIIKGLSDYRGDAKLATWIYTVTYHAVLHYTKREQRYSTRFLRDYFHGDPLELPYDLDYDKPIWVKEMCDKCLTGILHCLDAESRIAFLLRDMVQLSYEEVAVILEKEPQTVRKMISRSRAKLNSFLKDECSLFNPNGSCRCRMRNLVTDIQLPQEYQKLRRFVHRANLYLESQQVLPLKNYWESYL